METRLGHELLLHSGGLRDEVPGAAWQAKKAKLAGGGLKGSWAVEALRAESD